MKNKMIILLCAAFVSGSTYAQKISADKVPSAVMNAFKAKFPGAEKVSWEMEDKTDFEAAFKLKTLEESAIFNPTGKWVETEIEIKFSEMPRAVQQAVNKQFAGFKINEASKIDDVKHGNCYEVEIKKDKEMYAVLYSPEGKMLEKETMQKDKEDEGKDKD